MATKKVQAKLQASDAPPKKRGRPKGSTNKPKVAPDEPIVATRDLSLTTGLVRTTRRSPTNIGLVTPLVSDRDGFGVKSLNISPGAATKVTASMEKAAFFLVTGGKGTFSAYEGDDFTSSDLVVGAYGVVPAGIAYRFAAHPSDELELLVVTDMGYTNRLLTSGDEILPNGNLPAPDNGGIPADVVQEIGYLNNQPHPGRSNKLLEQILAAEQAKGRHYQQAPVIRGGTSGATVNLAPTYGNFGDE